MGGVASDVDEFFRHAEGFATYLSALKPSWEAYFGQLERPFKVERKRSMWATLRDLAIVAQIQEQEGIKSFVAIHHRLLEPIQPSYRQASHRMPTLEFCGCVETAVELLPVVAEKVSDWIHQDRGYWSNLVVDHESDVDFIRTSMQRSIDLFPFPDSTKLVNALRAERRIVEGMLELSDFSRGESTDCESITVEGATSNERDAVAFAENWVPVCLLNKAKRWEGWEYSSRDGLWKWIKKHVPKGKFRKEQSRNEVEYSAFQSAWLTHTGKQLPSFKEIMQG